MFLLFIFIFICTINIEFISWFFVNLFPNQTRFPSYHICLVLLFYSLIKIDFHHMYHICLVLLFYWKQMDFHFYNCFLFLFFFAIMSVVLTKNVWSYLSHFVLFHILYLLCIINTCTLLPCHRLYLQVQTWRNTYKKVYFSQEIMVNSIF